MKATNERIGEVYAETLTRAITAIESMQENGTRGPWECDPKDDADRYALDAFYSISISDGTEVIGQLGCGCCDVGLQGHAADFEMVVAMSRAVEPVLKLLRTALTNYEAALVTTHEIEDVVALAAAILGEGKTDDNHA